MIYIIIDKRLSWGYNICVMEDKLKLDLTNSLKRYEFKTKSAYLKFLQTIFGSLKESGDYVVYMHQVTGHRTYFEETKEEKIRGLKVSGLEINHYPTIHGTAYYKGAPQELNIEKDIADYNFLSDVDPITSFVFAIPKYITVHGQKVELATFDGLGLEVLDDKNGPLYQAFASRSRFGSVPRDPITKTCLLDTMGYFCLPNYFCLGMQNITSNGESYVFEFNPDHFSLLSKEKQEQILSILEQDAIDTCKRLNIDSEKLSDNRQLAKLIVESYDIFDKYCSADFDFYN